MKNSNSKSDKTKFESTYYYSALYNYKSDSLHAYAVILNCKGTNIKFELPKENNIFESVKQMIINAFNEGEKSAREKIRDALGIKDCIHEE